MYCMHVRMLRAAKSEYSHFRILSFLFKKNILIFVNILCCPVNMNHDNALYCFHAIVQ